MTGRYVRKPVPLEVRGLSRVDQHPLPDKVDNYTYGLGDTFTSDNFLEPTLSYGQPAYSMAYSHRSQGSSQESGRSTPTEATHSWMAASNGWTTGQSTERSSIYSLGEDEFDRRNSHRVRHLFEEIDAMLFEDFMGPTHVYGECKEWGSQFPHLRVLGRQLLPPQELGFHILPPSQTPSPRTGSSMRVDDVTEHDIATTPSFNSLSVSGQHVTASQPPLGNVSQPSLEGHNPLDLPQYEHEEVFAQDGQVEDIIALDREEELSGFIRVQSSARQKRPGMPPITPLACVRDNIGGATFDILWSEVIAWMRLLVDHYGNQVRAESMVGPEDSQILQVALQDFALSPPPDLLPSSREASIISSRMPDKFTRVAVQPVESLRKLDSVLTISSKRLQNREKSSLQDPLESPLSNTLQYRPISSQIRHYGRPASVTHANRHSARTRAPRVRLAPLERNKTPSMEEEGHELGKVVLRGHRMPTATDQAALFPRNGAPLPPIDSADITAVSKKKTGQRASSAIHDKEARLPYRDRDRGAAPLDGRPSTTHAVYRSQSDMPVGFLGSRQHSATPLGFSSHRNNSNHTALQQTTGTMGKTLNITGSSINPQNDAGNPLDVVTTEHLDEMIQPQWDSAAVSSQLRLGRSKQPYNMGSVR